MYHCTKTVQTITPASHTEPLKTKQVTRNFLQKQQDHNMSRQEIHSLQTSSLLCTEMVDVAKGGEERKGKEDVGEPGEKYVRGRKDEDYDEW